jgi:hypothetical protein
LSSGDLDVADEGRPKLLRQLTGGRGLRIAQRDQDELVAADPCQEGVPRDLLQAPRDLT